MSPPRFAFLVHPLVPWHRRVAGFRRGHFPMAMGGPGGVDAVGVTGRITVPTRRGPVEGVVITVPDLASRLVADQQRALVLEQAAVRIADREGVSAIGLGSALGVVAGRGAPLRDGTDTPITTGDASTAWTAARITLRLAREQPGPIGVLGFKGTVGDAVAHQLRAGGCRVLVAATGRAEKRARALDLEVVSQAELLARCRLIVGASTTGPILTTADLRPDSTLVDLALPPTLAPGPLPRGCRVFAGEPLVVPGRIKATFWGHIWRTIAQYGSGCLFACVVEPLAIAATGPEGWSDRRRLDLDDLQHAGDSLLSLGFRPALQCRRRAR